MKAQIWNFNCWVEETDPETLKARYSTMLKRAGFTVLSHVQHYFQPQGFTILYLLCESHFAVHTFPEEHKTYIELASCNKGMYDRFMGLLNGGDSH